jgi:hypothetical protein
MRVFRDIGRIFSLPFLLSHPLPVGHPLRGRIQRPKTKYGFTNGKYGFNCVSCGTHSCAMRAIARGSIHTAARKPVCALNTARAVPSRRLFRTIQPPPRPCRPLCVRLTVR